MNEDLRENILSAMGTVNLWEDVAELTDFRIAIAPNRFDVYCSKPGGEWYDEYTPSEDWTIYEVKDEWEAIALADLKENNYYERED